MNVESDLSAMNELDTAPELSQELEAAFAEVDVKAERLDGRKRQITARIHIPYPVDHIWKILTDYEHLADFIPNLAKSRLIEHPQGGIRLEQVGSQSFLKLKFCARVVLDMVERFPDQIDFQMVEGDFKEFLGSWQLRPQPINGQMGTELCYVVQILPPITMPIGMIERRLSHNLAMNLTAIRQRAEALFQSR